MHRAFVHLELNTDDIQHARAFYEQVLGWSFDDVPIGGETYTQINTPNAPGGGIQLKADEGLPAHWMPYIAVADVADTVSRARSGGARILVDTSDVEGHSPVAVIADPAGAIFGIWQVEAQPVEAVEAEAPPPAGGDVVEAEVVEAEVVEAEIVEDDEPVPPQPVNAKKVAKKKASAKKVSAKKKAAEEKKAAAKKAAEEK